MCTEGKGYKSLLAVKWYQESDVQGKAMVELEMASKVITVAGLDGPTSWAGLQRDPCRVVRAIIALGALPQPTFPLCNY